MSGRTEEWTAALRARLRQCLRLKHVVRAGWLRPGVEGPESVAAHSWGVAWLALVLCPEELDRERVLELAIVHDLAEAEVGDITPHDGVGVAEKRRREAEAIGRLCAGLPAGDRIASLWRAYDDGQSAEARFVKACDKLDMALQAAIYEETSGLDLSEFVESALAAIEEPWLRALAGGAARGASRP